MTNGPEKNIEDGDYPSSIETKHSEIPRDASVSSTEPKWKRETNKERKSKRQAMINICHYCKKITREPLKVEREVDGKRLKLENFGSVYYHTRCKVLSLMEGQMDMENVEDPPSQEGSMDNPPLNDSVTILNH